MGNKEREDQISDFVARHPHGTWIEEVADELQISRTTAARYLTGLEAMGRIEVRQEGNMKRIYPPQEKSGAMDRTQLMNRD